MRGAAGMIAAGMLAAVTARGADVNADLPVLSAYVWRGQVVNDEPVIQPALNVIRDNVALNAWGNFNTTDRATGEADFSEIDLTLSYGRRLGPLALGGGVIEYLFPNTAYDGTREVYLSASLPDAPVVPCLTLYRDVDEVEGVYASLSLSRSIPLGESASLALGASLGAGDHAYNDFYYGVDETAVNDANVGISLPWTLSKTMTLTPGLQVTWLPDSEIREGARALYRDDSAVVGSLKLTMIF